MLRIVPHAERPADAGGCDELRGDELAGGVDGAPVGYGEGVVCDGVADGTPDVDDADAVFEEVLGVGGEVLADATDAGFVGLVDVDAFLES